RSRTRLSRSPATLRRSAEPEKTRAPRSKAVPGCESSSFPHDPKLDEIRSRPALPLRLRLNHPAVRRTRRERGGPRGGNHRIGGLRIPEKCAIIRVATYPVAAGLRHGGRHKPIYAVHPIARRAEAGRLPAHEGAAGSDGQP